MKNGLDEPKPRISLLSRHTLLLSPIILSQFAKLSEDKYVEKVFNWSEFHLFEMTCYKIHTLVLPTLQYSKLHNILGFKPSNFSYSNLKNWRKQDDSKITPVYYNFTINGFEQKIRLQEDRLTSLLSNMNSDVRLQLATKMICTYVG